mmetsp:Transcript_23983/g.35957  ORF Transcript_23983/g.35957 Transcript_23983/m.35957 type:complete len:146 (+) Transcript_23983:1068-1505(+)
MTYIAAEDNPGLSTGLEKVATTDGSVKQHIGAEDTAPVRRSTRERKQTTLYDGEGKSTKPSLYTMRITEAPKSYSKASQTPEFRKAMKEELEALERNDTWKVVPKKPGMTIIPTLWVYAIKRDQDGNINRYKARLQCASLLFEPA